MYKPKSPGGEILEKLQNKPTDGIYFIAGHGTDNPTIEKKIPKGCKYCTFAECGLMTSATDIRIIHITNEFIKGNPIFKKPTSVNKLLQKMYRNHSVRINNSFTKNTKRSISIKNYSRTFQKIPKTHTAERARHTYTLSTYTLFSYYDGYNIKDFLKDITKETYTKDDIEYFFNNMHYEMGYSGIIQLTEREPTNIRMYKMFHEDDFEYFYELYDSSNDIVTCMKKTINHSRMNLTEMIKESFQYSIFPTVDMVLLFYNSIRDNVKNILQFKYEYNKRFEITQQDLFHYLPGTYYNFICRSTSNVEGARLRRQLSPMNPIGKSLKRTLKSLPRNRESFH